MVFRFHEQLRMEFVNEHRQIPTFQTRCLGSKETKQVSCDLGLELLWLHYATYFDLRIKFFPLTEHVIRPLWYHNEEKDDRIFYI